MNERDALFIFPGAEPRRSAVDEWFCNEPAELFALARDWYAVFRRCGPDVNELLHDGCPTACVAGAAIGYVNVFKRHVNVGFFTGAFLPDPYKMLTGSGKRMRHVKLVPGVEFNSRALEDLIANAYADVRARLNSQ